MSRRRCCPPSTRRTGMDHVALEIWYSTYPAILETIDIIAEVVKPALDRN